MIGQAWYQTKNTIAGTRNSQALNCSRACSSPADRDARGTPCATSVLVLERLAVVRPLAAAAFPPEHYAAIDAGLEWSNACAVRYVAD
jgi:hypothetical protein